MHHEKAAALFAGWEEALLWSCLQGYGGSLLADDENDPQSAIVDIGDFCFCAGKPDETLLKAIAIGGFKLVVPRDEHWQTRIERVFAGNAKKVLRYAIQKEPKVFEEEKLKAYAAALASGYELRLFDREICRLAQSESWSADLCSQFKDDQAHRKYAVGAAVLHNGALVSGAAPYAVYQNGIEIEIDTKPQYRGKGLATACGAALILECLSRGIYPSWDAHDLRSVHLAEKLGYHLAHPYVAYEVVNGAN